MMSLVRKNGKERKRKRNEILYDVCLERNLCGKSQKTKLNNTNYFGYIAEALSCNTISWSG